jgi:hypothetical protein
MFNKPTSALKAGLLNKRSCLAAAFGVTKLTIINANESGYTLLCSLSLTWMFNKSTPGASLLNKSSCLAPALRVTKFIIARDTNLVTLC